jgi:PadR family transcriptional regulator PadR
MDKDAGYERQLLEGWEEVFKKGQLTLWILLALKHGPKHMADIKQFIEQGTNNAVTADNASMYRALRRYYVAEMVDFVAAPGDRGPERKVYKLSPIGGRVLQRFVENNILNVFYKPEIRSLLERSI